MQNRQGKPESCYDHPRFYELAFAFRDIPREVEVIERTIALHARREVKQFLNLACGPSPHMITLSRRNLEFQGLDISPAMLQYSRQKAGDAGIHALFHQQSMVDFRLDRPVDYVFIALGDWYVRSSLELKQHLCAVAEALRPGGLFLLDWCIQFEPATMFKPEGDAWEMKNADAAVQCRVVMKPFNHPEQLFEERLDITVRANEGSFDLSSHSVKRAVYPQEFLELITSMGQFEFIGWWNNWNLDDPLTESTENIFRPITLLRRVA